MDKVTKQLHAEDLYKELVSYDPSLSDDKEAVLQVIEKMIEAKPVIQVNPQRRERFGERLADYIQVKKASALPKTGIGFWLTKRSFSTASLVAIIFIAGASYVFYQVEMKPQMKHKDQNAVRQLAVTTETTEDGGAQHDISLRTMQTSGVESDEPSDSSAPQMSATIAMQDSVKAEADISFQNSTHALQNTNTIKNKVKDTLGKHDGDIEKSTDVDTEELARMGGGAGPSIVMYDSGSGMGGGENVTMLTTASEPAADMHMQKKVALLFVDEAGTLMLSPVLDILNAYGMKATFVEANNELAVKLISDGHEIETNMKSRAYVELHNNNIEKNVSSLADNVVIVLYVTDIVKHPEMLKVMIESLQSHGYAFVKVSAIQR